MESIELIDEAITIIRTEEEKECNYIFADRYQRMVDYLNKLEIAYRSGKMNRKSLCLNIVRMLEHGDSENVQDAVSRINHYYQENIYEG